MGHLKLGCFNNCQNLFFLILPHMVWCGQEQNPTGACIPTLDDWQISSIFHPKNQGFFPETGLIIREQTWWPVGGKKTMIIYNQIQIYQISTKLIHHRLFFLTGKTEKHIKKPGFDVFWNGFDRRPLAAGHVPLRCVVRPFSKCPRSGKLRVVTIDAWCKNLKCPKNKWGFHIVPQFCNC